jgi:TolB-like protein/class 3 adenylate cyclase/Tfp pilus assembly protein PilF
MRKLERQLATIMFSDIFGYSKMMDQDEAKAIRLRLATEKIIKDLIPQYDGKIIQFYGDGAMSLFDSNVECLQCATAIQVTLNNHPDVKLRIGIHAGDVVIEGNNIYGEAVNIASRIESFCVPGAIMFSEKVFDDVRNQTEFKTKSLGIFQLKNITKSLELFALVHPNIVEPVASMLKGKGRRKRTSIAVLPFVNMSPDPENEYFSDGIAEEILNTLSKEEDLRVTARTSSFAFKGENLDVRDIGNRLDADVVLEGSVRKAGKHVRVTAQLINTQNGFHLFSQTYDRTLEDIFDVQDELAFSITNQLRKTLELTSSSSKDQSNPTSNIEAYNDYLRGLFYWYKYDSESAKKAIEFLESAIKKDPEFAEAYSFLSFSNVFLGATGRLPIDLTFPRARQAADKALELDQNLVEAHCAMGLIYLFKKWDLINAQRCFNRAKAINRESNSYLFTYALFLNAAGRFIEAVETLEEAITLDPVSVMANSYLAEAYLSNHQFKKALKQAERTLELFPDYSFAIVTKCWTLIALGELDKAAKLAEERLTQDAQVAEDYFLIMGRICSERGDLDMTASYREELKNLIKERPERNFYSHLIMIAYFLRDFDEIKAIMNQFLDKRMGGVIMLLHHPYFSDLFHEEEMADIKQRFEGMVIE